jgi:hypothetical protein
MTPYRTGVSALPRTGTMQSACVAVVCSLSNWFLASANAVKLGAEIKGADRISGSIADDFLRAMNPLRPVFDDTLRLKFSGESFELQLLVLLFTETRSVSLLWREPFSGAASSLWGED